MFCCGGRKAQGRETFVCYALSELACGDAFMAGNVGMLDGGGFEEAPYGGGLAGCFEAMDNDC